MSKVTVFVGLDYHKDSVVICAMDRNGKVFINYSRPTDAHAVAVLVASRVDHVRAAIEVPLDRDEGRVVRPGRGPALLGVLTEGRDQRLAGPTGAALRTSPRSRWRWGRRTILERFTVA